MSTSPSSPTMRPPAAHPPVFLIFGHFLTHKEPNLDPPHAAPLPGPLEPGHVHMTELGPALAFELQRRGHGC